MQQTLWEGDTEYGHYQVVDTSYDGRPARVLYSGDRQAAQSGVAKDGRRDLLFDYNQRFFELVSGLRPGRLLLIGGGVFTLPGALLRALPALHIDAVEPDAGLTDLAYKYFDLQISERLAIFNVDGRTYLREHAARYDMILVDAFTHTTIPRDVKTVEAFRACYGHLKAGGVLAMNVISGYYGPDAHVLGEVYAAALRTFDSADIFPAGKGYSLWLPQNFVLTAQRAPTRTMSYMRYGPVKPPEAYPGGVLEDHER